MDLASRRELLVSAALRVMRREGVAAATTRAICTEAQMPLGAFHYCFHGKAELFQAILDRDLQEGLDDVWSVLDPALSAKENLRAAVAAYWDAVAADPQWQLVLTELTTHCLRDPGLAHIPARDYATYHAQVLERLKRFREECGVNFTVDAGVLSSHLIAGLAGITSSWLAHRDDDVARAGLDAFVEMTAQMIETAPARSGRAS